MPTLTQDNRFAEIMRDQSDVKVSSCALDEAIEWIGRELEPEQVFSQGKLEYWAEANGYIHSDNITND